ncbi:MAG: hypothetical protein FWF15_10925, partial [Oscillospiraceae bacterium]|nr:hypothetical protein [Oscillospiraceae bacterium]
DSSIFFDLPHGVFALCREIIHGKPVDELDESEKYLFSIAIEKKLFIKDGDEYRLNYYFVEREEYIKIEELAKEFYATAEKYFAQAWQTILAAYKSDVPIHLRWQMGNFLSNNLNCFVTCSIYEAWKKELLSLPDENNKAWLSLFATE